MKKFKPEFTVVISPTDDMNDVFVKFANEKYFAEIPLNVYEICAIVYRSKTSAVKSYISDVFDSLMDFISTCDVKITKLEAPVKETEPEKKPNIFKRMWNKLFK